MLKLIRDTYKELDDLSLLKKIIEDGNEEAAVHLLYVRYYPLFMVLCRDKLNSHFEVLDSVIADFYIDLKGNDGDWHKLRTFGGRSHFAAWFKVTARNFFETWRVKMIEKSAPGSSLLGKDEDESDEPKPDPEVEQPGSGDEEYERRLRHVMLMEQINLLKNPDHRFAMLKYLEGYSSKETAEMLRKKWDREGVARFDKDMKRIYPSEGYVNVLRERAKKELKTILTKD